MQLPHLQSIQTHKNRASVLYSPEACKGEIINNMKAQLGSKDVDDIYKTSLKIRNEILNYMGENPYKFNQNMKTSANDVPEMLYTMMRWIIARPDVEIKSVRKSMEIDRVVLTISQSIMYSMKSTRQVKYVGKDSSSSKTWHQRENAQVVGLALSLHHDTRNKNLVELLAHHGFCIPYRRTLLLETAVANAVITNMTDFNGFIFHQV
jgi:hypothetical protein